MVSKDGDREHAIFLPLSQVEWVHRARGVVLVTMPAWLAKDRGLI